MNQNNKSKFNMERYIKYIPGFFFFLNAVCKLLIPATRMYWFNGIPTQLAVGLSTEPDRLTVNLPKRSRTENQRDTQARKQGFRDADGTGQTLSQEGSWTGQNDSGTCAMWVRTENKADPWGKSKVSEMLQQLLTCMGKQNETGLYKHCITPGNMTGKNVKLWKHKQAL